MIYTLSTVSSNNFARQVFAHWKDHKELPEDYMSFAESCYPPRKLAIKYSDTGLPYRGNLGSNTVMHVAERGGSSSGGSQVSSSSSGDEDSPAAEASRPREKKRMSSLH
jgi:hypothetical protein